MTETAHEATVEEVAQLDAEIQAGTVETSLAEEPDPREIFPLLKDVIEAYSKLLYGEGIYKISFSLDPMWVAKVSVDAYGDLRAVLADPDHPEEGEATLDPDHLGSFELIGDQAAQVGFAVDNLRKTVEALLFSEIHRRETTLDSLRTTLSAMRS